MRAVLVVAALGRPGALPHQPQATPEGLAVVTNAMSRGLRPPRAPHAHPRHSPSGVLLPSEQGPASPTLVIPHLTRTLCTPSVGGGTALRHGAPVLLTSQLATAQDSAPLTRHDEAAHELVQTLSHSVRDTPHPARVQREF